MPLRWQFEQAALLHTLDLDRDGLVTEEDLVYWLGTPPRDAVPTTDGDVDDGDGDGDGAERTPRAAALEDDGVEMATMSKPSVSAAQGASSAAGGTAAAVPPAEASWESA